MAVPSDADIARAEAFTREPFIHAGEEPALALAAGTPRRAALDLALAEIAEGRKQPSTAWRREFSLLLGLERVDLVRGEHRPVGELGLVLGEDALEAQQQRELAPPCG